MGSEKYPTENEYDDYIQKNAGSSNAYTELVGERATVLSGKRVSIGASHHASPHPRMVK